MASLVDDHYETLMARRNDIAARLYREPHLKQKLAEIDKELEIYDFSKFTKGQNPMTTTPADEIAAVEAALMYYTDSTYVTDWGMQEEAEDGDMARAGRTAFAAIVSRLLALEADNARLKAFVEGISHMNAEVYTTVIEPDFTDLIPQAAALLAASEEAKP